MLTNSLKTLLGQIFPRDNAKIPCWARTMCAILDGDTKVVRNEDRANPYFPAHWPEGQRFGLPALLEPLLAMAQAGFVPSEGNRNILQFRHLNPRLQFDLRIEPFDPAVCIWFTDRHKPESPTIALRAFIWQGGSRGSICTNLDWFAAAHQPDRRFAENNLRSPGTDDIIVCRLERKGRLSESKLAELSRTYVENCPLSPAAKGVLIRVAVPFWSLDHPGSFCDDRLSNVFGSTREELLAVCWSHGQNFGVLQEIVSFASKHAPTKTAQDQSWPWGEMPTEAEWAERIATSPAAQCKYSP